MRPAPVLLPPGLEVAVRAASGTTVDELAGAVVDGAVEVVATDPRATHVVILVRARCVLDAADVVAGGEGRPAQLALGTAQRALATSCGASARRLPAPWVAPLTAHWRLPVTVAGLTLGPGRLAPLIEAAAAARATCVIDATPIVSRGGVGPEPARAVVILVDGAVALAYTPCEVVPLPVLLDRVATLTLRVTVRSEWRPAPSTVSLATRSAAAAVLEALGDYGREVAESLITAPSDATLHGHLERLAEHVAHPLLGGHPARLATCLRARLPHLHDGVYPYWSPPAGGR